MIISFALLWASSITAFASAFAFAEISASWAGSIVPPLCFALSIFAAACFLNSVNSSVKAEYLSCITCSSFSVCASLRLSSRTCFLLSRICASSSAFFFSSSAVSSLLWPSFVCCFSSSALFSSSFSSLRALRSLLCCTMYAITSALSKPSGEVLNSPFVDGAFFCSAIIVPPEKSGYCYYTKNYSIIQ